MRTFLLLSVLQSGLLLRGGPAVLSYARQQVGKSVPFRGHFSQSFVVILSGPIQAFSVIKLLVGVPMWPVVCLPRGPPFGPPAVQVCC